MLHSKGWDIIQTRNRNSGSQRIWFVYTWLWTRYSKAKERYLVFCFQYIFVCAKSWKNKSIYYSGLFHVLPFRELWQDCQIPSINDLICIFCRFMRLYIQMMCVHLNSNISRGILKQPIPLSCLIRSYKVMFHWLENLFGAYDSLWNWKTN